MSGRSPERRAVRSDGDRSEQKLATVVVSALIVFSTVALGLTALPGTAAANTTTAPDCSTVSYAGTGAGNTPYEIENVDQLQCIGQESTGTSLSDDYVLVDDIDAAGPASGTGVPASSLSVTPERRSQARSTVRATKSRGW